MWLQLADFEKYLVPICVQYTVVTRKIVTPNLSAFYSIPHVLIQNYGFSSVISRERNECRMIYSISYHILSYI